MPKIEVEMQDKSYMIYVVYESPSRKIYLCKCDEEVYRLLINHFTKDMIYG